MIRVRSESAFRRLLDAADEDPLCGLANLFDAGVVLAVALSLTLVGMLVGKEALAERVREAHPLERFRDGGRDVAGSGVRLGVAYRLESGEVVCVPEGE